MGSGAAAGMNTVAEQPSSRRRARANDDETTHHSAAAAAAAAAQPTNLDEDLHAAATAQAQHQVQGRLLLNVVVAESATILELLACKDEALLVRRNALLVLNLRLHVVNGIG